LPAPSKATPGRIYPLQLAQNAEIKAENDLLSLVNARWHWRLLEKTYRTLKKKLHLEFLHHNS